jgi:hypothetical protein
MLFDESHSYCGDEIYCAQVAEGDRDVPAAWQRRGLRLRDDLSRGEHGSG